MALGFVTQFLRVRISKSGSCHMLIVVLKALQLWVVVLGHWGPRDAGQDLLAQRGRLVAEWPESGEGRT